MKRVSLCIICVILLTAMLPGYASAEEFLIPGGQVIGLKLEDDTVTIAAFDDALGDRAKQAGLQVGDAILEINGQSIHCLEDVRGALRQAPESVTVNVRRGAKCQSIRFTPHTSEDGCRLGLYLKQGITGIGTITWYDPASGSFGALGHGVNDGRGALLNMTKGTAYYAEVAAIKKGTCGDPGQLKGNATDRNVCGALYRNTTRGVFGTANRGWMGDALPVADFDEIRKGPACIRSTIEGNAVREYSVEILKIYPEDRSCGRNFLLKVTDPDLLSATGGIVQGMSGSPIIQDGKLVGAVTHVLVNDPTRGYGIFIENMLDAAS